MHHRHILALFADSGTGIFEHETQKRRGQQGGEQGHDDRHSEKTGIQYRPAIVDGGHTDTGDDQGNFTARNHAGADPQSSFEIEIHEKCRQGTTDDFGGDCQNRVDQADFQDLDIYEYPDIHQHTHYYKKYRNQKLVKTAQ